MVHPQSRKSLPGHQALRDKGTEAQPGALAWRRLYHGGPPSPAWPLAPNPSSSVPHTPFPEDPTGSLSGIWGGCSAARSYPRSNLKFGERLRVHPTGPIRGSYGSLPHTQDNVPECFPVPTTQGSPGLWLQGLVQGGPVVALKNSRGGSKHSRNFGGSQATQASPLRDPVYALSLFSTELGWAWGPMA